WLRYTMSYGFYHEGGLELFTRADDLDTLIHALAGRVPDPQQARRVREMTPRRVKQPRIKGSRDHRKGFGSRPDLRVWVDGGPTKAYHTPHMSCHVFALIDRDFAHVALRGLGTGTERRLANPKLHDLLPDFVDGGLLFAIANHWSTFDVVWPKPHAIGRDLVETFEPNSLWTYDLDGFCETMLARLGETDRRETE
ncbi:MAG: hypothetical protein AAGK78_10155, partial [Planctomycetota bacterium]